MGAAGAAVAARAEAAARGHDLGEVLDDVAAADILLEAAAVAPSEERLSLAFYYIQIQLGRRKLSGLSSVSLGQDRHVPARDAVVVQPHRII